MFDIGNSSREEHAVKILQTVKKVPGGMMVVPLLLGVAINTFFPDVLNIGGLSSALWKTGSSALMGAFLFCAGAQVNFRRAGTSIYKGCSLLITKVGIGVILGLLVNHFFVIYGVLGLSPLAIIASLTNKNGGLFVALAEEYGDETDVGAYSIIVLSDGPMFTMIAFAASGLAQISLVTLIASILPLIVGFILGNIDSDIRDFLEPGMGVIMPFFAFPLGATMSFGQIASAGIEGVILGVLCVVITSSAGYACYRLLHFKHCEVGAACGSTSGNAVGTPATIAAADPSYASIAATATAQVAATTVISAILCPFAVQFFHKYEQRRLARLEKKSTSIQGESEE